MSKLLEGMREGKRLQRRALPIALTALSLGLIFDWFFYGKLPGISVLLYTALILGITFGLARQFQQPLNKSMYWLTPVALFFALMVFVRANLFLAFINICLVIYLLLVVAQLATRPRTGLQRFEIPEYFQLIISVPLRIVGEFFQFLSKALNRRTASIPKSSATPIVRGLLLSLPILAVFLILLSSADLVFKQYVTDIFNPSFSPESIFRWCLIAFVTSLFIGAFALIFMPSVRPESTETPTTKKFDLGATEAMIILGSVSLLFLLFLFVQFAYLFGGSHQVASGYTYSEYARKGFFELMAVAAISLALLLNIKNGTALHTATQKQTFKWLSGVLIAEVMVIMASAHLRLSLYEKAYGFTTLRLWSHVFMLWLVAAFVLLAVYIIRESNSKQFNFQLFISILCFFALINIINPDAFIARENIKRYHTTGKLDVPYLGTLSEDAAPAIAELFDQPNRTVQLKTFNILRQQYESAERNTAHWQSANLARQQAEHIFQGDPRPN
jgi:hypothetical protein